ncbi:TetR/AcrR family transcriptional regulator [soil metagenome]
MGKGDTTRSTILSSAVALASEAGLSGVSIGTLAERTGMSKSGLFAHFASKENLDVAILTEAVARFISHVVAPALKEPRGEPRVRALFERWLKWPTLDFQPGGCIFMVAGVELDDRPGPARDVLVAAQRDWIQTLGHAASIAKEEKHFRIDLDENQFAYELFSLVIGSYYVHRLGLDPRSPKRVRASFERLIQDACRAERAHSR